MATSTALADVVAGDDDSYLTSFANAINAFGHPVLLTFDHEMNGISGYPWNVSDEGMSTGVTPQLWIEAWEPRDEPDQQHRRAVRHLGVRS